jgi:putative hemolysin
VSSRVPRQRWRGGTGSVRRPSAPGRLRAWAIAALTKLADSAQRASDALAPAADARSAAGRARRLPARLREARGVRSRTPARDVRPPVDSDEERRIISDVLAAGARHVSEVMVPRTRVAFLAADLDLASAVSAIREMPHSRFPVIDGSHDDIVGFVHLRDLLTATDLTLNVGSLAREVRRVPTGKRVLTALSEMRREGHHLAVVIDEYGGVAGIVTLEDLIEELVGEIHDEYDAAPEPEPGMGEPPADVDGRINLGDFGQRFGFELAPGPYETLGGFLMASLGRLPCRGDEVMVSGWRLVVVECEGHRVSRVAVIPKPVPDGAAIG